MTYSMRTVLSYSISLLVMWLTIGWVISDYELVEWNGGLKFFHIIIASPLSPIISQLIEEITE